MNVINDLIHLYEPSIICLQETKLNNRLKQREPIDGYKFLNVDGQNERAGAAILIKQCDDFTFEEIKLPNSVLDENTENNIQICVVLIKCRSDTFYVASIYCRPSGYMPIQTLLALIKFFKKTPYLLLGDFNARHIKWDPNLRLKKLHNQSGVTRGFALDEFTINNNLILFTNEDNVTRIDPRKNTNNNSTVDLAIASPDMAILLKDNFVLNDITNSDHKPIVITSAIIITGGQITPHSCPRIFIGYKMNSFKNEKNIEKFKKLTSKPPTTIKTYDDFYSFLIKSANKVFTLIKYSENNNQQQKRRRNPNQSWFWPKNVDDATKLKKKLRYVNKLKKKYRRSKTDKQINITIKRLQKENRSEIRKLKAKARQKKIYSITTRDGGNNSKNAWKVINEFKKNMIKKPNNTQQPLDKGLKIINPITKVPTCDPKEIEKIFYDFYLKEFGGNERESNDDTIEKNKLIFDRHLKFNANDISALNSKITLSELNYALKRCNFKSTPSPIDKVPYIMLDLMADELKIIFVDILNKIFMNKMEIPREWKISAIRPIPKPDKNSLYVENHRPVALTSNPGKVLEKIMSIRLSNILDNNNNSEIPLLSRDQYAYRKYIGCEDMLMRLNEEISNARSHNQDVYFLALDLHNAYNNMLHKSILSSFELLSLKKDDYFYKYIKNFLQDQQLCIKLNNNILSSSSINLTNFGIPQGKKIYSF